jgi:transcriptional regulator with XRE-family HTH domain
MTKQSAWWGRLLALAELAGDRTQQDIAETLGVSAAAVTGWKQGTPPSPNNVKAAARAYHVDALELLRIAFLDGEEPTKRTPHVRRSSAGRPQQF